MTVTEKQVLEVKFAFVSKNDFDMIQIYSLPPESYSLLPQGVSRIDKLSNVCVCIGGIICSNVNDSGREPRLGIPLRSLIELIEQSAIDKGQVISVGLTFKIYDLMA